MSELDATSELLLSFISHLDSYGAEEWSLRAITATVSFMKIDVFFPFRFTDGITVFVVLHEENKYQSIASNICHNLCDDRVLQFFLP